MSFATVREIAERVMDGTLVPGDLCTIAHRIRPILLVLLSARTLAKWERETRSEFRLEYDRRDDI